MSALSEEPENFLRWARTNHDNSVQARSFLSRSLYGTYMSSLLHESWEKGGANSHWIQGEALSLRRDRSSLRIQLKDGRELFAENVVLAVGNFPPANLKVSGLTDSCKRYVPFAWSSDALEDVPRSGTVLLVGSGLTSLGFGNRPKVERLCGKDPYNFAARLIATTVPPNLCVAPILE
jgi:uncharacterized NAD(P)/FAD-binding protein YdhS